MSILSARRHFSVAILLLGAFQAVLHGTEMEAQALSPFPLWVGATRTEAHAAGHDRHDVLPEPVALHSQSPDGGSLPVDAILGRRLVAARFMLAGGERFIQPNPNLRLLWKERVRTSQIKAFSKISVYTVTVDGDDYVVTLERLGATDYVRSIRLGALTEYYDLGAYHRSSPEFVRGRIFGPQFSADEIPRVGHAATLSVYWSDLFVIPGSLRRIVRPGVANLLQRLRQARIRIVLWTDGTEEQAVELLAAEPSLSNIFDRVVTRDAFSAPTSRELQAIFGEKWEAVAAYLARYPQALPAGLFGHFALLGDFRLLSLPPHEDPILPYRIHALTGDLNVAMSPELDATARAIEKEAEIFRHPNSPEYQAAAANSYFNPTSAWRRALSAASPRPGARVNVERVSASHHGPRLSAEPDGIMLAAADFMEIAPYFPEDVSILILSNAASHFHLKAFRVHENSDGRLDQVGWWDFKLGVAPSSVDGVLEALITSGHLAGKQLYEFLVSIQAPDTERWSSPTIMFFSRLIAWLNKTVDYMRLTVGDSSTNPALWEKLGFIQHPTNASVKTQLVGRSV